MTTNREYDADTRDTAKAEAARVARDAEGAARNVAGSAREEARQVTGEATDQIRALVSSARDEAFGHASTQQEKLAGQSRIVSDDLQRISRGEPPQSDLVNQLLSTVTSRVESFTTALESREPADLLRDVRRFAARRPGAFLAAAAGIGLLAGRLTRGLGDSDDDVRGADSGEEYDFDGRYRVPAEPGAYGPPSTTGLQGGTGVGPVDPVDPVDPAGPTSGFGDFPEATRPRFGGAERPEDLP